MVGEGGDWSLSSKTVTTPRLLSRRAQGVKVSVPVYYQAPMFHTNIERVQSDSDISQHLNPSNLS
eukprot:scaffold241419_cov46-Cyclotella_meneghiniana.AAC.1